MMYFRKMKLQVKKWIYVKGFYGFFERLKDRVMVNGYQIVNLYILVYFFINGYFVMLKEMFKILILYINIIKIILYKVEIG